MKHNKIIAYLFFIVLLAGIANAEKYFALDVNYIQGSVTFNSINLREIDRTIKHEDKSGFLIKAVSFDGSDMQKIYYNMSENRNYVIYVPYDKNTEKILVYNPGNSVVIDLDVSSFAETCGNKICEPYESYENCPQDCKSGAKDDFCDRVKDSICDPDCAQKEDTDCAQNAISNKSIGTPATASKINNQQQNQVTPEEISIQSPNYLAWILLLLGAVISALIFFFIKKIKEKQVVSSLKQYIGENIRKGFTLQQIKDTLFRAGYKEKEIDKAIKSI